MATLAISIPDEWLTRLQKQAVRLHITPEELVRASIAETLARNEEAFERAADYVLVKNAELYRRLA